MANQQELFPISKSGIATTRFKNAPLQTLPESNNYLKRKFEDDHELDLSQYQAKYGELKFNEEF